MVELIQASLIEGNLSAVRQRMETAARSAGRNPDSLTLIAVSKTYPATAIKVALAAGQLAFGENRVQEAEKKFADLRQAYAALKLHMIGPLQTNKAPQAVALFDAIHSIDRPKLAEIVGNEMRRQNKRPSCFIEVNIGQEPQKSGIAPGDLDAFLVSCKEQFGLPVAGLMCIPPAGVDPRPYFARLAELSRRNRVSCLSMGMSADFETAIATGATHVRVGSAIFGERG